MTKTKGNCFADAFHRLVDDLWSRKFGWRVAGRKQDGGVRVWRVE